MQYRVPIFSSETLEIYWNGITDHWTHESSSKDHVTRAKAIRAMLIIENTAPREFENGEEIDDYINSALEISNFETDTRKILEENGINALKVTPAFPQTWSEKVKERITPEDDLVSTLNNRKTSDYKYWENLAKKGLPKHLAENGLPLGFLESLYLKNYKLTSEGYWLVYLGYVMGSILGGNLGLDKLRQLANDSKQLTPVLKDYWVGMFNWLESSAKSKLVSEWQLKAESLVQGISEGKFIVDLDDFLNFEGMKPTSFEDLISIQATDPTGYIEDGEIELNNAIGQISHSSRAKSLVDFLENWARQDQVFNSYLLQADKKVDKLPSDSNLKSFLDSENPLLSNSHNPGLTSLTGSLGPLMRIVAREFGKPCYSMEKASNETLLQRANRWICEKDFSEQALSQFLEQLREQADDIIKQAVGEGAIEFLIGLHPVGRLAVIAKEIGESIFGVIEATMNISDAQEKVHKSKTVVELQSASANLALANIKNGTQLVLSLASLRGALRDIKTKTQAPPEKLEVPAEASRPGKLHNPQMLKKSVFKDELSDREISNELLYVYESTKKKLTKEDEFFDKGYIFEVSLPNSSHKWRGKIDGKWCRFSKSTCVDVDEQSKILDAEASNSQSQRLKDILDDIDEEMPGLRNDVPEDLIEEVMDLLGEDTIDTIILLSSRRGLNSIEARGQAKQLLEIARDIGHIEGAGELFKDLFSRGSTIPRGAEFELRWAWHHSKELQEVAIPRARQSNRPLKGADALMKNGDVIELKNFNLSSAFYSMNPQIAARRIRRQIRRRLKEGFNSAKVIFSSDAGPLPPNLEKALREELDELANSMNINRSSLKIEVWPP